MKVLLSGVPQEDNTHALKAHNPLPELGELTTTTNITAKKRPVRLFAKLHCQRSTPVLPKTFLPA